MEYNLKIHFTVDGIHYHTKGFAPCTEDAFHKGEFSGNYIKRCAFCIISGYMGVNNLEGSPELVSWAFEHTNA